MFGSPHFGGNFVSGGGWGGTQQQHQWGHAPPAVGTGATPFMNGSNSWAQGVNQFQNQYQAQQQQFLPQQQFASQTQQQFAPQTQQQFTPQTQQQFAPQTQNLQFFQHPQSQFQHQISFSPPQQSQLPQFSQQQPQPQLPPQPHQQYTFSQNTFSLQKLQEQSQYPITANVDQAQKQTSFSSNSQQPKSFLNFPESLQFIPQPSKKTQKSQSENLDSKSNEQGPAESTTTAFRTLTADNNFPPPSVIHLKSKGKSSKKQNSAFEIKSQNQSNKQQQQQQQQQQTQENISSAQQDPIQRVHSSLATTSPRERITSPLRASPSSQKSSSQIPLVPPHYFPVPSPPTLPSSAQNVGKFNTVPSFPIMSDIIPSPRHDMSRLSSELVKPANFSEAPLKNANIDYDDDNNIDDDETFQNLSSRNPRIPLIPLESIPRVVSEFPTSTWISGSRSTGLTDERGRRMLSEEKSTCSRKSSVVVPLLSHAFGKSWRDRCRTPDSSFASTSPRMAFQSAAARPWTNQGDNTVQKSISSHIRSNSAPGFRSRSDRFPKPKNDWVPGPGAYQPPVTDGWQAEEDDSVSGMQRQQELQGQLRGRRPSPRLTWRSSASQISHSSQRRHPSFGSASPRFPTIKSDTPSAGQYNVF